MKRGSTHQRVMLYLLSLLLSSSFACGEAPVPEIESQITIEAAIASQVGTLEFFVFDLFRSDGIELSCNDLFFGNIQPDDSRLRRLAQTSVTGGQSGALLTDVSAGGRRIVHVRALDNSSVEIGRGCTANVTITKGNTAVVQVLVGQLP